MINNLPFSRRKKVSTLLALSAILTLLLTTTPLLLFNIVPVQAQTTHLSFRTTEPAKGSLCTGDTAWLTFDAQGTASSDFQHERITSGSFQVTNSSGDGQILYSGKIVGGSFTNTSTGGVLLIASQLNHVPNAPHTCGAVTDTLSITTSCRTADSNSIDISGRSVDNFGDFTAAVECSQGGGDTTTQSSSSMNGTTTQDGDGDGIPNANDNCPNLPHTRCYKEGDTSLVIHNSNR